MKKIGIITATRAEYGLLAPVVKELRNYESEEFSVDLVVTGTHLEKIYGNTIDEIVQDEVRIDHIIKIPTSSNSEKDISVNQAQTLMCFTELFYKEWFNAILILGDRYEMLAIAIAASNTRTPIFHLCGGDTTEGAMDEWIRHSITKMSYIHFVTNEQSRKRVVQLGEDPSRVYNFGSTSIDNIINIATLTKEEALKSINLPNCEYVLCTYHPVTMENNSVEIQIGEFLNAITHFPNIQFIITKSNADQGGALINRLLDEADNNIENVHVFSSLGVKRYLSLMRYAKCVLGNSSSGIIETPAFHVPTVNIGDRQKGRLQSNSIIDCKENTESIISAIDTAMSSEFVQICLKSVSLYGDGFAAKKIAQKTYEIIMECDIDLKKSFYEIERSL